MENKQHHHSVVSLISAVYMQSEDISIPSHGIITLSYTHIKQEDFSLLVDRLKPVEANRGHFLTCLALRRSWACVLTHIAQTFSYSEQIFPASVSWVRNSLESAGWSISACEFGFHFRFGWTFFWPFFNYRAIVKKETFSWRFYQIL